MNSPHPSFPLSQHRDGLTGTKWRPSGLSPSAIESRKWLPHRPGVANAEIAASLFMSAARVKAHVSHLLDKLDVRNRVQRAILVHDAGDAPDGA